LLISHPPIARSLTPAVCDDALASNTGVIVVYHPPLFAPTTSLTLATPLHTALLRCVAAGVSVFCPHTSLDSTRGGVNDWLAQAFAKHFGTAAGAGAGAELDLPVQPIEQKAGEEPGVGIGRLLTLAHPTPLAALIPAIKHHLGVRHGACRLIQGLIQAFFSPHFISFSSSRRCGV
jgi:putative NIF3 family GTP cyclohydrolase 1 type 2